MIKFSLSKLTERSSFTNCYGEGRRYYSAGFVLFVLQRENGELPFRLGMAVTRKTGCAVWRNRVRRLIREFFRLRHSSVQAGYDYVVVPKRTLEPRTLNLAVVDSELTPLLRKVAKTAAQPRSE